MKKIITSLILIGIYSVLLYISIKELNNDNELILSMVGTVFGGLFLSLIYLVLYDFIYRIPDLSGKWEFTEITTKTSFNPYNNMEVTYLTIIWNEGRNIFGSGEKIFEKNQKEEIEFKTEKRVNIEIEGHIKKRYFWDDEIVIHYIEDGRKRKSSTIHKLKLKSRSKILGSFFKTAANASGSSNWIKKEYDQI